MTYQPDCTLPEDLLDQIAVDHAPVPMLIQPPLATRRSPAFGAP